MGRILLANPRFVLPVLLCFFYLAIPCARSSAETVELEVREVDYATGLVEFLIREGEAEAGDVLSATTSFGAFEGVVLEGGGDPGVRYLRVVATETDALLLLEAGDRLTATVTVDRREGEFPPETADLLEELTSLEREIGGLLGDEAAAGFVRAASEPRPWWKGWRGDTGVRVGYDRYSRSGVVITDLDPTDRESVERALQDLDELIQRAREVPGINQSDLDRAREFADAARAILADPDGDLEEASANIVAGRVLVETAVDRAGRDPDTVRVEEYREETEDTTEGYTFLNLRKDFDWSDRGVVSVAEHLEGGTRFFAEGLDVRADRRFGRSVRFRAESNTDLRIYRTGFTDDFVGQRVDLEIGGDPSRRVGLAAGGEYILRKEFNTSSDDGSQFIAPRVEGVYRMDRWGRLRGIYEPSMRRYNADRNRDLDYSQDRYGIAYENSSRLGFVSLRWEQAHRDADLPMDKDDSIEDLVSLFGLANWTSRVSVGVEGTYTNREYTVTGPFDPDTGTIRGEDNTDFRAWSVRPFLEYRAGRDLTTTVAYRYLRLTNEDRVPEDDIDKSLGDYDIHRVELSVQWRPGERWEFFLQPGFERRNYLNGETGQFETWFSDFHNLADYDAWSAGGLAVYHATEQLDVELEAFYAEERYPTFEELDTDQTTVQAIVRYIF
jgi:hypothetical protein